MISKLDLGKTCSFAHTEGVLELGGRALHIIVGRVADIGNGLLAEG